MNKEQMTIGQLYDTSKSMAGAMMERYTYPWEVLPHIGEIIAALSATLPRMTITVLGEMSGFINQSRCPPSPQ